MCKVDEELLDWIDKEVQRWLEENGQSAEDYHGSSNPEGVYGPPWKTIGAGHFSGQKNPLWPFLQPNKGYNK